MGAGNVSAVWTFLYRAAWTLARPLAVLAPAGAGKLARSVRGRRGAAGHLARWAALHRDTSRPLVWFHAASVGEGRQAETVLVRLRRARPDWQVAWTHSSASAERLAGTVGADVAGYVPADTPGETGRVLDALRPSAIVFSATDLWPELVRQAARRAVPVALVSATLAPTSSRRGSVAAALLGPAYAALEAVGAIAEQDAEGLRRLGVRDDRIVVTGDTRHDAAAERVAATARDGPAIRALARPGPPLLVAGSTWPGDERALLAALADVRRDRPLRVALAPHEPSDAVLAGLERDIAAALPGARVRRLAALERDGGAAPADWDVCLVDRVGVLADLYVAASLAFVGGGFHDAGLHAVIEPAAAGVPVLFGPRWRSSRDAGLLLDAGGGRSARDAAELAEGLRRWLADEGARQAAGRAARDVVERGVGAADRTVELVLTLVRTGRR